MMATGLADCLRAAGLRVEEVAGWQDRGHGQLGRDGDMVVVNHHTAGSAYGRAPSLSTCIYGVPGVPGPLCNVMQTREDDGNDAFIVIAAGISYNAGTGGYAGVSGNYNTIGLECEHTGVVPYPDHRATLSQRFDAAVLKAFGQPNGDRSCQHFEWSDTGKPDIGSPRVDAFAWRARVTEFMHGAATPPPQSTRRHEMEYGTNPHNRNEVWCTDGIFKRFVSPVGGEWPFMSGFGGYKLVSFDPPWFDSLVNSQDLGVWMQQQSANVITAVNKHTDQVVGT